MIRPLKQPLIKRLFLGANLCTWRDVIFNLLLKICYG